jgi:hypothetical protein
MAIPNDTAYDTTTPGLTGWCHPQNSHERTEGANTARFPNCVEPAEVEPRFSYGGCALPSAERNAARGLERIKGFTDEIRRMREGTSSGLYHHYSGAISNLRALLRMHGPTTSRTCRELATQSLGDRGIQYGQPHGPIRCLPRQSRNDAASVLRMASARPDRCMSRGLGQ